MIYYFSGTGNSKWVAEYIASKLGDEPKSIIKDSDGIKTLVKDSINSEVIGFVYPCYCAELPKIFKDWIISNDFSNVKYIWAVCTCGANSGRSYSQIKKLLPQLMQGRDLIMPDNCVTFAHKPEKVKELLDTAQERSNAIIENIKNKSENYNTFKSGILSNLLSKSSWIGLTVLGESRKTVDNVKCVSCGKCVKTCPTNNITLTPKDEKKISFSNKCAHCYACIQICDSSAISFGSICPNENTRYFHD